MAFMSWGRSLSELLDEKVSAVQRAMTVQLHQVAQLRQVGRLRGIEHEVAALKLHFEVHQAKPWEEVAALLPAIEAIEAHYQQVRLSFIEQQEQTFEEVYGQLQYRLGYSTLTEEKAARVSSPLREALTNTTQAALQPPLIELKEPAQQRLYEAVRLANRYLDDAIAQETGTQTIEFSVTSLLSKREVSSVAEVDALLGRLRSELVDKLEGSADIRIRLI